MKVLSIKLILPVAAFVLASAGAVSTSNSVSAIKTTDVQGWKRIAPSNCEPVRECNNISEAFCVDASNNQMYGKPTPASDCTELLTHQP
ncbi:DUF6520 family protein [Flavobacterium plurextorum]|jgi:hypothetical protein|uniref:DUF6520 family protein n=1 Tax=Flavobacterium TaxID=237 RepID=UPI00214D397F|nr:MULTISPECIES: DUF6520 family protein [Flavobacterium]UUW07292.1 DUF6520 family protein [Flavobacterium plurextorum]